MTTILTGKSLPRRTVLKGLGASLALPFLDSMFPAFGLRGQAAPERVHRFQTFYVPNGMAMEYWSPTGEGRDFGLTPILEPLEPFREQMLVLSGIRANWVQIHAGASGSFLTGIPQGGTTETEIIADVSMDQLLAQKFGQETQLASLELSMDAPANAGACSSNLSCVYTHTLSWRGPTQPLPTEYNPRDGRWRGNPSRRSTPLVRQRAGDGEFTGYTHGQVRYAGGPDRSEHWSAADRCAPRDLIMYA